MFSTTHFDILMIGLELEDNTINTTVSKHLRKAVHAVCYGNISEDVK